MINKYSLERDGELLLSEHFKVKEFKSYSDEILIDDELIKLLEQIFKGLECGKIIITSGYRTKIHDLQVTNGKGGTGQHTLGKAADFVAYDKDNKIIHAKYVCCVAQDLNVNGIGFIADNATHIDTRSAENKWWGDEVRGEDFIKDFYAYFDVQREIEVFEKASDIKIFEKGIDVSEHQGKIDWKIAKERGIDFAIIRAGYGMLESQKDKCFDFNYENAKANRIKVGAYWYSYAKSIQEAEQEADVFLSVVDGKQFEYPVYFDIEDKSQENLGVQLLTDIVLAFCNRVQSKGYYVGLYCNPNWINYKLDKERLKVFDKWLAHWTTTPAYGNEFGGLWQYSASGKINGIATDVDLNYSYRDYETLIKKLKLNGNSDVPEQRAPEQIKKEIEVELEGQSYKITIEKR